MLNKYTIIIFLGTILIITMSIVYKQKADVIGHTTWEQWLDFSGWELDKEELEESKNNLKKGDNLTKLNNIKKILEENPEVKFIFFSGSWCGDSYNQMPDFMNIVEFVNLSPQRLDIIGVTRDKTEPNLDIKKYNIKYLPTLIILDGEKELGRIIETPDNNWIDDILLYLGHI